ncbi:MAG TPA: hypothetical protein VMW65_03975 [Chloroflexota bacterium]|nr:hypothetical protein [Chloroflexota bacterium]
MYAQGVMVNEQDRTTASRETLLAVLAEQATRLEQDAATIAELQRRIAALERRLGTGGGAGMPGNKPTRAKSEPASQPRKKRPHGFGRPRLTPTQRVQHVVETCPDCGTHLEGGWVQRTREVIEVPLVPACVCQPGAGSPSLLVHLIIQPRERAH